MEIDESVVLADTDGAEGESIGSVVPLLGKEVFKEKKGRQWLKFSTTPKKGWRKTLLTSLIVLVGIRGCVVVQRAAAHIPAVKR